MSNLELQELTLKNFLSVGNVTQAIKLNDHDLTLIIGKNLDVADGINNARNGTGKTTILQAISFVLYGEPVSEKFKLDNLINNKNEKNMLVTLAFKKGNDSYRIERGRKPNILRIFKNGSDSNDAKGENKHSQDDLIKIIGMSHMMFCHLVGLNTYTDPFLKLKVADQRELIEELLGVSLLSERDDEIKIKISEVKKTIDIEQAKIKATIDANTRIEAAIEKSKNDSVIWEASRQNRIKQIQTNLTLIDTIDVDKELQIFDQIDSYKINYQKLNESLNECNGYIKSKEKELALVVDKAQSKPKSIEPDIERLHKEIHRYKAIANKDVSENIASLGASISSYEKEIEVFNLQLIELNKEIDHLSLHMESNDHNCGACGQRFIDENHITDAKHKIKNQIDMKNKSKGIIEKSILNKLDIIEKTKIEINNIQETNIADKEQSNIKIQEIENLINDLTISYEKEIQDYTTGVKKLNSCVDMINADLVTWKNDLKTITANIAALIKPVSDYSTRDEIWIIKNQREQLLKDIENENMKENPAKQNIENMKETIQDINYDAINEYRDDLEHLDFIHKLLVNKDSFVRKKIIEQNLYYLNSRINYYLDKLGLPHEIVFLTDLSVRITLMGIDYDYPQLSTGQRGRAIPAINWAFRDVWENLNFRWNLMFVDELLDNGIDDAGVESAVIILNKMSREQKRNILLISHRDVLLGRVESHLVVNMEDGFTRFEENGEI